MPCTWPAQCLHGTVGKEGDRDVSRQLAWWADRDKLKRSPRVKAMSAGSHLAQTDCENSDVSFDDARVAV